jgi:predicted glutamine amidotransferase
MCRLLAYVAREASSPLTLLGEQLPPFVALSHRHSEGWGLAWYDDFGSSAVPMLTKAPVAAHGSASFAEAVMSLRADALIAHLRWATTGMSLCSENTHPFTYGPFAFAHNGGLEPLEAVEELIAPHLRATLAGTTDSERYFLALVSALERLEPTEALRVTLGTLHRSTRSSSLNALLLTPVALYAVADYDPQAPMARREPEYYQLSYKVSERAIVIGSSGWQQGDGWTVIPNGQVLVVERGSLRSQLVQVVERAEVAGNTAENDVPDAMVSSGTIEKDEHGEWRALLQR